MRYLLKGPVPGTWLKIHNLMSMHCGSSTHARHHKPTTTVTGSWVARPRKNPNTKCFCWLVSSSDILAQLFPNNFNLECIRTRYLILKSYNTSREKVESPTADSSSATGGGPPNRHVIKHSLRRIPGIEDIIGGGPLAADPPQSQ